MYSTIHGEVDGPAVAVVGSWDPLLNENGILCKMMTGYARRKQMRSVAIVLTPHPGILAFGRARFPHYNDFDSRVSILLGWADAVMHVNMSRREMHEASAAQFLDRVRERLPLAELWMGAKQSLGTGPSGSGKAVLAATRERGIRLKVLTEVDLRPVQKEVRRCVLEGAMRDAAGVAGRPAVLSRPKAGRGARVAWPAGVYGAVALRAPDAAVDGEVREVRLSPRADGMSEVEWPDRSVRYLAFVAGPGDAAGAAGAALTA